MTSFPMFVLCACALLDGVCSKITLSHLKTDYLPWDYENNGDRTMFQYDNGLVGMAVDKRQPFIYALGSNLMHILDFAVPSSLKRVHFYRFDDHVNGKTNAVDTCQDIVAVTYNSYQDPLHSLIYVFKAFSYNESKVELLIKIQVGCGPKSMIFTSDCSTLLVTLDGSPVMVEGEVVDPEGEVAIIRFNRTLNDYSVSTVGFQRFNDVADEYLSKGVRWTWRGEEANITNTFSQNLAPDGVALNKGNTKAFITLQDNNAIATLDLETDTILEIYPLGSKSWKDYPMDASDRDGGPVFHNYDIYGLYQPGQIMFITTMKGKNYLLVADEGHDTTYTYLNFGFDYSDMITGKHIIKNDLLLNSSETTELREQLSDDSKLGRHNFSRFDGLVAVPTYWNLTQTVFVPTKVLIEKDRPDTECMDLDLDYIHTSTLLDAIGLNLTEIIDNMNTTGIILNSTVSVCIEVVNGSFSWNDVENSTTDNTTDALQNTTGNYSIVDSTTPGDWVTTTEAPLWEWINVSVSVTRLVANWTDKYAKLFSFGGRSFSIYDPSDMSLVYSTNGMLEKDISAVYPTVFNAKSVDPQSTPEESMDMSSPHKGSEPGAVEYGEMYFDEWVGTKRLVFVGMENPGIIGIYSLNDGFENSNGGNVVVESMHYFGGMGQKWKYLWASREMSVCDIKTMVLLKAGVTPNPLEDDHLLIVLGSDSGTVSVFKVFSDYVPPVWNKPFYEPTLTDGQKLAIIIAASFALAVVLGIIVSCYQDSDSDMPQQLIKGSR